MTRWLASPEQQVSLEAGSCPPEVSEAAWCWVWEGKAMTPLVLQKADGTCNTNFKKTQKLEQVTKVLEDFVDGNHTILVSGTPMPPDLEA